MNNSSPFLAVPIRALVAADGTLLHADPPLWRLHVLAGGDSDGILAIPGMLALAAITERTKMATQRAVMASDEEHDVELWVETRTEGSNIELLVTGWRDLPSQRRNDYREHCIDATRKDDDSFVLDAEGRIVRMPHLLPNSVTGQAVDNIFEPAEVSDMLVQISEGKTLKEVIVKAAGSGTEFILNLAPQYNEAGHLVGHIGSLRAKMPEAASNDSGLTPMPMGRQFASVLRQPLSRIVANAETIGSRLRGPLRDNYAEYAQDIANAARHLTELVADMEDLEAIDRPDFAVARDRIELGDIARRVAGLLALKASDHGMTIQLPDANEKVEAIGEFRRVLQIMLNLVGNAIRYAPDGSVISVQIKRSGNLAIIEVADQGNGVSDKDRERIFDKFERLGRSGDGGSGLGLYISRRLARAMEGNLAVADAPGGGARFTLSLPAR